MMKEDQRIRLSKQMLRESLLRLLQTHAIHSISVRQICEEADINRATFYKYFSNPYDLLGHMEDEVLSMIDTYLGKGASTDKLTRILTFIEDNLDLCRVLFNNNTNPDFPEKLFSLPLIREELNQKMANGYGEQEMEHVYNFVVNGGYGSILKWMNAAERESAEVFADFLGRMIKGFIDSGFRENG